jgi:hypothetical protein
MTEDMRVAGLAAGTQRIYLDGVRRLARHYRRAPDELSEAEVRTYLLGLRERGVALGTFKTNPPTEFLHWLRNVETRNSLFV